MNEKITILGLLAILLFTGCSRKDSITEQSPNIIFILADDMGYGDAGCYGNTNLVPTPNIDRIADEGVRFTDGYVTAPICAPARYGLLTGVYQQKFGVRWNVDAALDLSPYGVMETPDSNRIKKPIEVISEPLERAGYSTVLLGKWNLPQYPTTTFDEAYSVMHFVGEYYKDEHGVYKGVDGAKPDHAKSRAAWGPTNDPDNEYLTDRIGRQAAEYIDAHKDQPFFMYVAFNAPHTPLHAKEGHKAQVEHLASEPLKLYGAMQISMDENIGKILDALDRNGLTENTMVAFMSDNGASFAYPVNWPDEWEKVLLGSNGKLRGHKGQMYEGGIRVPFAMRYPKVIQSGQVYSQPVSALDLYPTFCAAAGAHPIHLEILDGVNLIPFVNGDNMGVPHDILYWYGENVGAVRAGKYKYFYYGGHTELYDLEADLSESNDLSEHMPGVKKELEMQYEAFIESLPPPINPNRYDKFNPPIKLKRLEVASK